MIKKGIYLSFIILLFILTLGGVTGASVWLDLPSLPPPELYGNIIIDRVSTISGVKPVTFSHWSHRLKHTCRVCHFELEMNMVLNTTMTERLPLDIQKNTAISVTMETSVMERKSSRVYQICPRHH
jgi:hypothetical protein